MHSLVNKCKTVKVLSTCLVLFSWVRSLCPLLGQG